MSELWCKTCGAFILYPGSHVCPPQWECWHEDEESREHSARKVYARNSEAAATEWAKRNDEDNFECAIAAGNPAVVCVVPLGAPGDSKPLRFDVTGELVPEYTAEEIEDEIETHEDDDVGEAHA